MQKLLYHCKRICKDRNSIEKGGSYDRFTIKCRHISQFRYYLGGRERSSSCSNTIFFCSEVIKNISEKLLAEWAVI